MRELSVPNIHAHAFNHGKPVTIEAFETGELWQYVWTRDLAYAADLGLAGLDVQRVINSLLYKTSELKPSVGGKPSRQILQDTGSGGSYPVSTDRVVWALAAERVRHFLNADEQADWVKETLPILIDTIEQDRALVFNPATGLYRGEQSFLDWREQTYPTRTANNVLAVATSESLSTNVTHYVILKTAAAWAGENGQKYAAWAERLKVAINDRLWDDEAGLYAGYLLVDPTAPVRIHRYDLLGNCLAILHGIAGRKQSHRILDAYPTGPFGPPVVWPQESTVAIYHNHAIWPFVTAYWAKAARHCGHEAAVASAIDSITTAAARHLSNMENLDVRSGDLDGHSHGLVGPKINSRRQLWSVAGSVGIVRDVLFGMETTERGVRFIPCIPNDTREQFFAGATELKLTNVSYRGKRIDVTIKLPEAACAFTIETIELNGKQIEAGFVAADDLLDQNAWTVRLKSAACPPHGSVTVFDDFANPRALFGPPTPDWRPIGQGGISVVDGLVTLHYWPVGDRNVSYTIYRDGRRVARGITATDWTDPDSADWRTHVREYAVEAVYPETGTCSYPTAGRSFVPMPPDEDDVPKRHPQSCGEGCVEIPIDLPPGHHVLRLRYANGTGAINTGLTCCVKRAELVAGTGGTVAGGYFTMPQTGGWELFQLSSCLTVTIEKGGPFTLKVFEDAFSRNMSHFSHNAVYTAHEGGGPDACNVATIDGVVFRPAADAL
ncbi:MAG: hypothetical protein QM754_01165 [Tepidisphaeraceae bacterium]